jgi:hypothetical protein
MTYIAATPEQLPFNLACNAHEGISFDPEKRARQCQAEYAADVQSLYDRLAQICRTEEQLQVLRAEVERYRVNYLSRYSKVLHSRSRCLSWMITGPSNFPTRRNQKRMDVEHRRTGEFLEWRDRARAAVARAVSDARSPDMVADDEWQALKKKIDRDLRIVQEIDAGSPFSRSAFVTSLAGVIERLAANGQAELVAKALAHVREQQAGMKKPVFTDRHSVWKLGQAAETASARAAEREAEGPRTLAKVGEVEIIEDPGEDRVQIFFPGKPSEACRAELRGSGWKWSPRNGCWQRKATLNARAVALGIVKRHYGQQEAAE